LSSARYPECRCSRQSWESVVAGRGNRARLRSVLSPAWTQRVVLVANILATRVFIDMRQSTPVTLKETNEYLFRDVYTQDFRRRPGEEYKPRVLGQVTVYRVVGVWPSGLRKSWRFLVVGEEYIWAAPKGSRLGYKPRAHHSLACFCSCLTT
jgi:hypothetical protein